MIVAKRHKERRGIVEVGAIFPQTELSADPGAIRAFVQAVEDMGYANLFVADHVLGADTQFHHHPALASYSYKSVVHEPLTLLGYLAAVTTRITLAPGILILPQRQDSPVVLKVHGPRSCRNSWPAQDD